MDRELKIGHIHRHFKGGLYVPLAICKHSETKEDMVVYLSVKTGQYWVRPLSMFLSEVDREKYPEVDQKYRFEPILEGDKV